MSSRTDIEVCWFDYTYLSTDLVISQRGYPLLGKKSGTENKKYMAVKVKKKNQILALKIVKKTCFSGLGDF